MRLKNTFTLVFGLLTIAVYSQKKIDTDSLWQQTATFYKAKEYDKVIANSHKAIKIAPSYLDFHLVLGNVYWKKQQLDSARYYLKHVIATNPKYQDAFTSLVQLETEQNNLDTAYNIVDNAIKLHPKTIEFVYQKLVLLQLQDNPEATLDFLNNEIIEHPKDSKLQQALLEIRLKNSSNRIGINYSITGFNKAGVGPWQLTSLQYIRERKKISWIGQLHYADRQSNGISVVSGLQFEIENYWKHSKKNYSYMEVAYSNATVFPKWRLAYSWYQNIGKAWEADLGIRFSETSNRNVVTGVAGIGKYIGSYWFTIRSYFPFIEGKTYSSFTATTRYYWNTKYDYLSASIGYGTSPDERENLALFDQRFRFASYRFGLGYHKLFGEHYIAGLQTNYNRQEYKVNNFQNEYNVALVFQYKF